MQAASPTISLYAVERALQILRQRRWPLRAPDVVTAFIEIAAPSILWADRRKWASLLLVHLKHLGILVAAEEGRSLAFNDPSDGDELPPLDALPRIEDLTDRNARAIVEVAIRVFGFERQSRLDAETRYLVAQIVVYLLSRRLNLDDATIGRVCNILPEDVLRITDTVSRRVFRDRTLRERITQIVRALDRAGLARKPPPPPPEPTAA